MIKYISLIIPHKNDQDKLSILLSSILDWKVIPNEIIIINTSENEIFIPTILDLFVKIIILAFINIKKNICIQWCKKYWNKESIKFIISIFRYINTSR